MKVNDMSALLIDLEATEMREHLPNLPDLLLENPHVARIVDMLAGDVLHIALRQRNGEWGFDVSSMSVRLAAWQQLAQEALAITE